MKKSDMVMIILIASISMIIAFFVARAVFGDVYQGTANVKTIDTISSTVEQPSTSIFNKSAINPSIQVQINGTK